MSTVANRIHILIADDDDGHALLIKEHLEEAGIDNPIRRFRDGAEVWAFLSGQGAGPNDTRRDAATSYLLLLDIRMPRMDGVEVLRRIKSDGQLKSLPVIMLTTTDDPREVAACYDLGCNSYVTKPIRFEAFSEVIRRLGLFISVIALPQPGAGPDAGGTAGTPS
jgi:CheY-like chemotaxis protein